MLASVGIGFQLNGGIETQRSADYYLQYVAQQKCTMSLLGIMSLNTEITAQALTHMTL